jgi:ParB-like chromosome segregation protein Spo0J
LQIEQVPVGRLIPYVRNARTHSADQIAQIAASIAEFGFTNPILIGEDDVIIAGHGRLMAAQQLGLPEVPVIVLDHLSEAQRRALLIADNRLAESAGWDDDLLRAELAALREEEFDLDLLGFDEAALDEILAGFEGPDGTPLPSGEGAEAETGARPGASAPGALAERFGVPPFSILDARKGWWQDRKRAWIDLGIRSELGRGAAPGGSPRPLDRQKAVAFHNQDKLSAIQAQKRHHNAAPGGSPLPATDYAKSKARGDGRGRPM